MSYAIRADDWYFPTSEKRTFSATKLRLLKVDDRSKNRLSAINEIPIHPVIQKLKSLKDWGENWDGADANAVNAETVERGMAFIHDVYSTSLRFELDWHKPNVTASPNGEAVLEWWSREKKLTVYVNSEQIDYVKVWGPDIDNDMEDGIITSPKIMELLGWLEL